MQVFSEECLYICFSLYIILQLGIFNKTKNDYRGAKVFLEREREREKKNGDMVVNKVQTLLKMKNKSQLNIEKLLWKAERFIMIFLMFLFLLFDLESKKNFVSC